MSPLEAAPELLRRKGALQSEDVLRHLVQVCELLQAAGPTATVTLEALRLSEDPLTRAELALVPLPIGQAEPARAQVRAVAALGYELLKGMPPPLTPSPRDWLGERPELVQLLAPALMGEGAPGLVDLAHQLRTLARPHTAVHAAPIADTVHSVSKQVAATTERAGEVFGAYELVRRLGSGGMGDVYLARHVRLGREVAIKVLRPELAANEEIVRRFFQEAKVVNEINHPHIVEIHDFVEEPGRVYLVMELLQGGALSDVLATSGGLDVRRAAGLFGQVCDALDAAHRRGVVHRDIKPDNIFVTPTPDGRDFVRVLDFGIARRLVPGGSRTEVGAVLGTPYYMAPEQAAGRPVDARADVYSVGVALYEAFTGAAPSGDGPLTLTRKGEAVPPQLSALLARCVALDPAQRPPSAAELRDVLQTIAGAPPPLRPTTAALEAAAGVKASQRRRGPLVAVTLLLLVGAATSWSLLRSPELPAATKPVVTPQPTLEAAPPVVAPALPPGIPAETAVPPTAAKPRPRPVVAARPMPDVTAQPNPFAARGEAVKRRHDTLLSRFGASQLTSLERAAVAQALDDLRLDRQSALFESLQSAEAALDAAERRLTR